MNSTFIPSYGLSGRRQISGDDLIESESPLINTLKKKCTFDNSNKSKYDNFMKDLKDFQN